MPYFVELRDAQGKDMLLNLDQCIALAQDEKGNAVAVSISGTAMVLGESFAFIKKEMLAPADPMVGS